MAGRRRSILGYDRQRRPHSKLRMGCDNCKRRRIKCSEQFPQCIECTRHKVACLYSRMPPEAQQRWLSKKLGDQRVLWSAAAAEPEATPQGLWLDHLAWIPVQYHYHGPPPVSATTTSSSLTLTSLGLPPLTLAPLSMAPPPPPLHSSQFSNQLPPLLLNPGTSTGGSPLAPPAPAAAAAAASDSFYHQPLHLLTHPTSLLALPSQHLGTQGLPHMVLGQAHPPAYPHHPLSSTSFPSGSGELDESSHHYPR